MAKQPDIQGWASTTWGMTEAEILQLFPSAKRLVPPVMYHYVGPMCNNYWLATVGVPQETIGDFECRIDFIFDEKSGLKVVVIQPFIQTPTWVENISDLLTDKYGRATKKIRKYDQKGSIWRFPSTVIALTDFDLTDTATYTVSLTYNQNAPDFSLL